MGRFDFRLSDLCAIFFGGEKTTSSCSSGFLILIFMVLLSEGMYENDGGVQMKHLRATDDLITRWSAVCAIKRLELGKSPTVLRCAARVILCALNAV